MFRHQLLAAFALTILSTASSAQTFATINGRAVSCREATAYRDGELLRGFVLLESQSEVERDVRRKETVEELEKHIRKVRADWAKKSADLKRKMALSFATYVVATTVKLYGDSAIRRSDISAIDKRYAEVVLARSVDLQKTLIDTGFGSPPSLASIAGLPLGTILGAFPQGRTAATIFEAGTTGIDVAVLYGDLKIGEADTFNEIAALERALKTVSERMTNIRRESFLKIKRDIDQVCSN